MSSCISKQGWRASFNFKIPLPKNSFIQVSQLTQLTGKLKQHYQGLKLRLTFWVDLGTDVVHGSTGAGGSKTDQGVEMSQDVADVLHRIRVTSCKNEIKFITKKESNRRVKLCTYPQFQRSRPPPTAAARCNSPSAAGIPRSSAAGARCGSARHSCWCRSSGSSCCC